MTPVERIELELQEAKKKWPNWVCDPIHAAVILGEEAGELMRAANQFSYENGSLEAMEKEAAQAGAMAIRFLAGLQEYKRIRTFI